MSSVTDPDERRKPDLSTIEPSSLAWRSPSVSNGAEGMCVQVAAVDGGVAVRDSKNPDGPMLAFSRAEFAAFAAGLCGGEYRDLLPRVV